MKKAYPIEERRKPKLFKLHPEVIKKLEMLADKKGISQAKVIETLITSAWL